MLKDRLTHWSTRCMLFTFTAVCHVLAVFLILFPSRRHRFSRNWFTAKFRAGSMILSAIVRVFPAK